MSSISVQNACYLLMVRPHRFSYNAQTAVNNSFQTNAVSETTATKALQQFDAMVQLLQQHDINVLVVNDDLAPDTPDSVFPNNVFSTHHNGTLVLYPMFAPNRQSERKLNINEYLSRQFAISEVLDLYHYEQQHQYLEGTGSMVLDRENKIAYACLSPRTDIQPLLDFCTALEYTPVTFTAINEKGIPIYHTNVMMTVATQYAILCTESISNPEEQKKVISSLQHTGKEIIEISLPQMNSFAGNMLQVSSVTGKQYLVMSTAAYQSLTNEQLKKLAVYNEILHTPVDVIETNGGGSVRCMIAEVFLQAK